jgi:hypothetical protein
MALLFLTRFDFAQRFIARPFELAQEEKNISNHDYRRQGFRH